MDPALTWDPQVESICNKVKSVLYRLKRISAFTDAESRASLISSLVFPLFDYCSAIYGDLSSKLDTKLQVALNSCVRHVYGLSWRDHITPYRSKLKWLSARNRRLYLSSCLLHKIHLSSLPAYLSSCFQYHVPTYPTRIVGPQIHIKFSHSQLLLDSFSTYTAKYWNSLPPSLRMTDSIQTFKSRLKNLLLKSELLQQNLIITP